MAEEPVLTMEERMAEAKEKMFSGHHPSDKIVIRVSGEAIVGTNSPQIKILYEK